MTHLFRTPPHLLCSAAPSPSPRYARVDQAQRETFQQFTKEYFTQRANLTMVFLLIDSTITPQPVGMRF